jgi:predicted ABC-type sugar transport system permease subunit
MVLLCTLMMSGTVFVEVGALIIATLNNGMTLMGVSYFWQLVIKGAVIIIRSRRRSWCRQE